jgi:hypothetical protein
MRGHAASFYILHGHVLHAGHMAQQSTTDKLLLFVWSKIAHY